LLQYEFWTRSLNSNIEKSALKQLHELGFLMSQSINFYDASNKFWDCFQKSLIINKKGDDGKQRILSIIANDFIYEDLQKQLSVCINKVVDFDFHNCFVKLFYIRFQMIWYQKHVFTVILMVLVGFQWKNLLLHVKDCLVKNCINLKILLMTKHM
jgi:hypothetical protein